MKRAARAIRKLHQAERYRRSGGFAAGVLADVLAAEAKALLTQPPIVCAGEVAPVPEAALPDDDTLPPSLYIKNTLEEADAIAMEAPEAQDPGVRKSNGDYGRCRMHGARGGPKTPEGIERIRQARIKSGYHSAAAREERRSIWKMGKEISGHDR